MDSTSELDTNGSSKGQEVLGLLRSFHSFEPGERDHAISVLQSLDREPTIESLLKLLRDADGDVRCDAAEALMRIDSKLGTEAVLPLLADLDADVRWHTCGLLYDFGDERVAPRLVEVLRNDPEGHVRFFAADALGKVGDLSAVPSLRHAAQFDTGQDYEGRRVSEAAKEAIESILVRYPKKDVQ
ncbi:MAG TPA: HEAT repeat domain-containing protein [Gemmataceae bacterium]|jgi:hypothetical protein